jgi:predicted enzyme related to lactoylglutathione lyase
MDNHETIEARRRGQSSSLGPQTTNCKGAELADDQLVTGVDFVSVPTHDIETAAAFYGDTLRLPRRTYMPERGFAEFQAGNLTIGLMTPEKMGMEYHASRNPIALQVADMETARGELEQAGVQFAGDTFDTGVCHMAFFADPDGNALMLHHRYAPRES